MLARLMGKADAVAAAVPSVPTEADLKTSRAEIESQLRTLTKERDGLSLASLSGDANATTAIESIDRDRQRLAGQVESINAALRELASKPRERKLSEVGDVGRLIEHLRYEVNTGRENLIFNVENGNLRDDPGHIRGERLDGIEPLTIARRLLAHQVREEPVFTDVQASAAAHEAAQRKRKQLADAREAEISRLADELVQAADIAPLPDALARYAEGK
jgi:hypothetical protein